MGKSATVLAIETSCDETGVAVVTGKKSGNRYELTVREHLLHSQIATHKKTGGVVPEVAAREHAVQLPRLLVALSKKIPLAALMQEVDAIAVTAGPGLVTSLLVGVEVTKTIALAWEKPLVPVNHLEGHVYASLLKPNKGERHKQRDFVFPLLVLIVSGGHTELVLMKQHLNYRILGTTRDDAAGEAFDKTAKLLGLPYPGGPALSTLARTGDPTAITFPRPMLKSDNLEFSFSGLKTAVATYLKKQKRINRRDVAASIELAIVDALVGKTIRAVERYRPAGVVIAGGVAANRLLRSELEKALKQTAPKTKFFTPLLAYTTDNGAMIGAAGVIRSLNGTKSQPATLRVNPHLPLK